MIAKYLGSNVVDLINLNLFELFYIERSTMILVDEENQQYNKVRKR